MSSKIGALATPLKSPCDQRERGRERAYERSECAKASVAEAVRAERQNERSKQQIDSAKTIWSESKQSETNYPPFIVKFPPPYTIHPCRASVA